ncbi:tetratricopeptide repeat protein [bacterium]|nr:tetratricopeptide repeat protein [bacterium]
MIERSTQRKTIILILLTVFSTSLSAAAMSPQDRKILNMGNIYFEKKAYFRAIEYYDKIYPRNRNNAELLLKRGRSYSKIGYDEKALKDLNLGLKLNPTYGEAYKWRGDILAVTGQYDRALKDYDYAEKHHGGNLWSITNKRAKVYILMGKPDQALSYLTKAIEIHRKTKKNSSGFVEDERLLLTTRSGLHQNRGDYKSAIKDMTDAIKSGAFRDDLYLRRAELFFTTKHFQEAFKDYSTILSKNPVDETAWEKRAEAALAMGNLSRALLDVNKALECYPGENLGRLYRLRARVYDKQGKKDLADKDRVRASKF